MRATHTKQMNIEYAQKIDCYRHILIAVIHQAFLDANNIIESGDYSKNQNIRMLTRRDAALFFIDGRFAKFAEILDLEPNMRPAQWDTMRQALDLPAEIDGRTWNEYVTERHERQMAGAVWQRVGE